MKDRIEFNKDEELQDIAEELYKYRQQEDGEVLAFARSLNVTDQVAVIVVKGKERVEALNRYMRSEQFENDIIK